MKSPKIAEMVMSVVMREIQEKNVTIDHLMNAQFDASKALADFPLFEYFKIRDGLRIFLVNRTLVI